MYKLSDEVKTATKALRRAAEIGTLSYVNGALTDAPDKDAILVMSFGTTYEETRKKTIEATVSDIKDAFSNVKVALSFTSHIIIERIKQNEGKEYPTPEEALKILKKEGYTRVALVTLNIIPGLEYGYNYWIYEEAKRDFKKVVLGTPLIYWQGQENQDDDVKNFIKAMEEDIKTRSDEEAVLLLAHGTPQPANAYYSVIQAKLNDMGYDNAYVYTVEGWPNIDTVIPKLKAKGIKRVKLQPMMMVAGDHAVNDMAGEEPKSHLNVLTRAGFNVSVDLKGLGEIKKVRELYVDKVREAWGLLRE